MKFSKRLCALLLYAFCCAVFVTACEPQRPEVIDEVEVDDPDNDAPPAHRVEPIEDDERDDAAERSAGEQR